MRLAIGLLMMATTAAPAAPVVFHVAPNGNDAWTGRPAAPTADGRDGPFATVQHARDTIRRLKSDNSGRLPGPVTVRLRSGTYQLAEPLTLVPEDSGTAECPVVYEAFPGKTPILSGGRALTGWRSATVNGRPGWAVEVPGVRGGTYYPHQLWINGERRPRARHPNGDGVLHVAGLPAGAPARPGQDRFTFTPGDLKPYAHLDDVEIVALHLWIGVRLHPIAIDAERREVRLLKNPSRRLTETSAAQPFARYYVENAAELLDEPGEWYLDRASGVLSYLPKPGEAPERTTASVPACDALVRLAGRPEKGEFVEHVTLRGLRFEHWERWPDRADPCDVQAAANVPAGVSCEGARRCAFERCTVAHGSGYGLHLARGCRECRVDHCELFDLGAGGVQVGEMRIPATDTDLTAGNTVTDCHIHDLGRIFPQGVGVWVGQSPDNHIEHNHIHALTYTGVSIGWTWGYDPARAGGNVVASNHIHDIGRGLLSDMAGVYTLGTQPGTVVRNNVIHDVAALRYGGWGIYFDEGSTGIVAEDNLVYRTTHGGFHQHYGKDNVVRNNVFALGRDAQIRRTRAEPHRSFTFEHNLVYWKTGVLLDGQWGDDGFAIDRNLYWRPGGGEVRFGKWSLEEWQAKGHDRHSLVTDPVFEDPDQGDFRFPPGSPAAAVGFKMPDFSTVGPRPRK